MRVQLPKERRKGRRDLFRSPMAVATQPDGRMRVNQYGELAILPSGRAFLSTDTQTPRNIRGVYCSPLIKIYLECCNKGPNSSTLCTGKVKCTTHFTVIHSNHFCAAAVHTKQCICCRRSYWHVHFCSYPVWLSVS
ncbi:MAG: hypothetical protein UV82_C0008G0005 [Candidatus Magasanikbacteria bacterium GW2011_GWD2_43_18]|uniref:Uncharacterized protein n=1 Tax=Candidatus Magasanikbacteria bacterium GW2011_GWE2_42_7 TaxID=1619052 RepID=A0A0G1DN48_9BACT|nr:MAG: hypothetical protein UV42_C0011G0009 [Candidatus Magasanikbacteria bacterium GW2011_GWE2_42_7]KKT04401.1 MAG: hypothetical protein UV82_C0008G0005 [Candidatus Magasanikbacteria bacterium GW2011_GWD2_43_18]KKT25166.1 MAG: hypothetical protein UW10_C0013G0023 [Candidatus Magasanikbacteria bacterium GW2011_GWA2_43_9]